MIYICKGCSKACEGCGKACDGFCKLFGKLCDPCCKILERPLGWFVLPSGIGNTLAAGCAMGALADEKIRNCTEQENDDQEAIVKQRGDDD